MSKTSYIEKYNNLCKKFTYISDEESSHIFQDKVYREFIKDTSLEKIPPKDIPVVARIIKKVIVKNDKDRWYA